MRIMLLALLLFVPATQAAPGDLVGTILNVTDINGMYINITKSNITGLDGVKQIILPRPINNLKYFLGKALRFDVLGHDILGRPVVDAYLGETKIEDLMVEKVGVDAFSFLSGEGPGGRNAIGPIFDGGHREDEGRPLAIAVGSDSTSSNDPVWMPRLY